MRRLHLWGQWYLQRRKHPLGSKGFCVLIHVAGIFPEFVLTFFVAVSVLIRLRRKVSEIISALFSPIDRQSDLVSDEAIQATAFSNSNGLTADLPFLGILLATLIVLGFWISGKLRRIFIEVLIAGCLVGGLTGIGLMLVFVKEGFWVSVIMGSITTANFGFAYLLSFFRLKRVIKTKKAKVSPSAFPP